MSEDGWVPPSLRTPAGYWLTRDQRPLRIAEMGIDHLHRAIRLFTRHGFGDHHKIRELCRELARREDIILSTEIFPTIPLRKDEVLARDLPDFEWRNSSRGDDPRYVRELHHASGGVAVYFGNGRYTYDRGYRRDAVWFEAFGLGGKRGYTAPFFDALGRALGCRFVAELGNVLDAELGYDSREWSDELEAQAIAAIERFPGSTGGKQLHQHPKPTTEYVRDVCPQCSDDKQVCNACSKRGGECKCSEGSLPTPMPCPTCCCAVEEA